MKKILLNNLVSALVFLFITGLPAITFAAPQPLDKIVVVINSEVITNSQLQKRINVVKKQNANAPLPDDATLRQKVLDQMIDEKLMLMLAKRNKLEVNNKQLDVALTSIAARNNLTLDQLQSAVEKQGIDYNNFRQQIHDQILIQQVEAHALGPILAVSNQEIKDFLRQHPSAAVNYHLQDILIPITSNDDATITAAQKNANNLLQQLQSSGANQANVLAAAKDVQTNDLGFRTLQDLPEIFMKTAQTMKAGDIKGPIRAPNGFHLLKLVETKSSGTALTTDQVRQILIEQKLAKNLPDWLKKMRATAYVKIMD